MSMARWIADITHEEVTMKITTIALATVLSLSSTFALAQAGGGAAGGSAGASGASSAGTTTGGTTGTGAGGSSGNLGGATTTAPNNTMSPSGNTLGPNASPSGSTLGPSGAGSGVHR